VENDEWWHYLETDIRAARHFSIGDIALAPGNPDVVWVGTGESNVRTASPSATAFIKSTDAGKTWQHMGLKDSERISAIVINPQNPDIVYVGALAMHSARTRSAVCL